MSKMRKLFPTMHDEHVWNFVRLGLKYEFKKIREAKEAREELRKTPPTWQMCLELCGNGEKKNALRFSGQRANFKIDKGNPYLSS